MKTCGPVATGRPVTAMLPCEMRRYIAGFAGEARKSGHFWCLAANRTALRSNPGALRVPSALTFGKCGYILARMSFEIILAPDAFETFKRLKARFRAEVRAALETHLRHEPRKVSRSRVKRLRGLSKPQY